MNWSWLSVDPSLALDKLIGLMNQRFLLLAQSVNRMVSRFSGVVYVTDYGAILGGAVDCLPAINTARAVAVSKGLELAFPGGIYGIKATSALPAGNLNLGYTGLTSRAQGTVTFKRLDTFASPVLSIDSGSNTLSIRKVKLLGDFRLRGNATTSKGLYTRGLADSTSEIECTVIDGGGPAFHIAWNVLPRFKLSCSSNLSAFTTPPTLGLQVDETQAGFYSVACQFDLTIEGFAGVGAYLKSGSGNILRGTCEGMTKGVVEDAGCNRNQLVTLDCEGNTVSDAELSGRNTILDDCFMGSSGASSLNVQALGSALDIFGGYVRAINKVGSDTGLFGVQLSDNGGLGLQGAGTYRSFGSVLVDGNFAITSRVPDVASGYTNAMTGVANRATAYDTTTITLLQLAERVKALTDDFRTKNMITP